MSDKLSEIGPIEIQVDRFVHPAEVEGPMTPERLLSSHDPREAS